MSKFVLIWSGHMNKKLYSALVSMMLCVLLMLSFSFSAVALDDKYNIDELGMSIKVPKEYVVITRSTEADDEALAKLKLDYNETMTAFSAADIYMQATSPDGILRVTLTMDQDENSEAINNYSDLSTVDRQKVLDMFLQNLSYTSGTEIKHNGNIYFDMALTQQSQEYVIYCYQCHTVVNGMNINLSLEKNEEELTQDEIKVVTNMANTITFDKISNSSGPSFEWWRILLWIALLVVVALLAKYFYAQYINARKDAKKNRARHSPRTVVDDGLSEEDKLLSAVTRYKPESGSHKELLSDLDLGDYGEGEKEEVSFDELLGYDTTDYSKRAHTSLDSFDIKVKVRDENSGVQFFEDNGKSINDKKDYFDEFFNEEIEHRPAHKRFFSAIALYSKMMCRRITVFFKNLIQPESKNSSDNRRKRK